MAIDEPQLVTLAAKVQAGVRAILVDGKAFGIHTVRLDGTRLFRDGVVVFAEDDCGNWIGRRNSSAEIVFVDHETSAITVLARDLSDLIEHLVEWKGPDLKPGRVKRAWIDPEFLKKVRR